jgi:hypothetical protein
MGREGGVGCLTRVIKSLVNRHEEPARLERELRFANDH